MKKSCRRDSISFLLRIMNRRFYTIRVFLRTERKIAYLKINEPAISLTSTGQMKRTYFLYLNLFRKRTQISF